MFQNPYLISRNEDLGLQGKRLKGKVIAHHQEQNGLIKIRLDNIHDDWPEDCIPWQQADAGFGHGNNQSGKIGEIPPIGAETYSRFLSDNQYHPVYTAGPSSDEKKIPDFTDPNVYPYAYGSIDQGGHKEVINTKEGEESYTRSHVKGTSTGIDKDGNINHMSPAAIQQVAKQIMALASESFMMGSAKDGHLKFGEKLIIEAKNIEFRHSGATSTMPIMPGAAGPTGQNAPTLPSPGKRPEYASVGQDADGTTTV